MTTVLGDRDIRMAGHGAGVASSAPKIAPSGVETDLSALGHRIWSRPDRALADIRGGAQTAWRDARTGAAIAQADGRAGLDRLQASASDLDGWAEEQTITYRLYFHRPLEWLGDYGWAPFDRYRRHCHDRDHDHRFCPRKPPPPGPPPGAVPEPGTWLMLLGGFLILGAQLRGRRRARAAALRVTPRAL